MTKITDLTGAAPDSADVIPYVDVSDTTEDAAGTAKKATVQQIIDAAAIDTSTLLPKTGGADDPMTGVLYLDPGSDDAATLARVPVTSSTNGDILLNLNRATFNSTEDVIFNLGFNQDGGGSPVDAALHMWYLQMEFDYNDGGGRWVEFHLNLRPASGTTFRPFEFKYERDGSEGSLTLLGSTYSFQNIDNTWSALTLTAGADAAASQVNVYGALGVRSSSTLTMYGGQVAIQNPAATRTFTLSYADAGPVAYINNSVSGGTLVFQNWDTITLPGWDIRSTQIFMSRNININGNYNFIFSGSTGTQFGTNTAQKMGFWGATPGGQPTVSGARDTPEAALASLLTALDTMGLINDTTTAS